MSHTSEFAEYPADRSFVSAALEAVAHAGHVPVDMRFFPAADRTAAVESSGQVGSCDVYIGILGRRYGSIDENDEQRRSYTEAEYDTATALGLPRLIFTLAEDADVPGDLFTAATGGPRQDAFLQKARQNKVVQAFAQPQALGHQIYVALRALADGIPGPDGGRSLPKLRSVDRLMRAVRTLGPELADGLEWTEESLRSLVTALPAEPRPAARQAGLLLERLLLILPTVDLVADLRPTTVQLRRAVAALGHSPVAQQAFSGPLTDADYTALVDAVVFGPGAARAPRAALARFLVELAVAIGRDPASPRLQDWATRVEASRQYSDALAAQARRHGERRLRLIVSLHSGLAGDWPDQLHAWLLDGPELALRADFSCPTLDRLGAERAYAEALRWGKDYAHGRGERLRHIDVALPARLMLTWKPETVRYGDPATGTGPRIGASHDVMVRWSERLAPARHHAWINQHAADCLHEMAHRAGDPVEWLGHTHVADLGRLREQLADRRPGRALGLSSHPGDRVELLELLLAYQPVVLWPEAGADVDARRRRAVDGSWYELPDGLVDAYRSGWTGEAHPLAGVRAAWHDDVWLAFCRSHQPRTSREL
ncbi:DUF4062 domain-containing protein [Cryptosporangium sp. NPDC051539]|uniref:DUF4062 domain-containing protein n=1 Tax=Cryptosporangium sp. NPDC051539 TaxID=3363962 RepID=UPI0037A59090